MDKALQEIPTNPELNTLDEIKRPYLNQEGMPTPSTSIQSCLICGDKAKCCNFGVLSCESCKVFFRRSATRMVSDRYTCFYEENCRITVQTRKLCQYCRLQKCIGLGMKSVGVIARSRSRQREIVDSKRQESRDAKQAISRMNQKLCPVVMVVEVDIGKLTEGDWELVRRAVRNHDVSIRRNPFTDDERKGAITDLLGIVNILDGTVRRILSFAKLCEYFTPLCVDDQVALLKGAAVEIMLTRMTMPSIRRYTPEHGLVWVDNGKIVTTEKRVEAIMGKEVTHSPYVTSLVKLNLDDTALVLLTYILLFMPERRGLSCPGHIKEIQCIFMRIFRAYLMHLNGTEAGEIKYSYAMASAARVGLTSGVFGKHIVSLPREEVKPVLHEYFDLEEA